MTIIAPMRDPDRAFVFSGWSSSLRMTRDVPFIRMASWADLMRAELEAAASRPNARTLVALGGEPDIRKGFLCHEADHVLYVYVAQPYRRAGVARALFNAANIDPRARFTYACRTKSSWLLRGKVPFATYDPYRARFAPGEKT